MKTKKINDKYKLYKYLWWYKKPWYNWTKFETDMQGNDVQDIIEALNIKKYGKRIEFIYDRACLRLDEFYKGKDLCKFCDGKCLFAQRGHLKDYNGCCRLCRYQSDKGCTTSNLTCKSYYCGLIRDLEETLEFKDISLIKLYSIRQRIMCFDNFYASREDFLLELKIGLIIFYSFHTTYRMIKNFWWLKNHKQK
jgi:hypothetical protein